MTQKIVLETILASSEKNQRYEPFELEDDNDLDTFIYELQGKKFEEADSIIAVLNKTIGYRVSLWKDKTFENRIAWEYNPEVVQDESTYRSKILYECLAQQEPEEVLLLEVYGKDVLNKGNVFRKEDEFGKAKNYMYTKAMEIAMNYAKHQNEAIIINDKTNYKNPQEVV